MILKQLRNVRESFKNTVDNISMIRVFVFLNLLVAFPLLLLAYTHRKQMALTADSMQEEASAELMLSNQIATLALPYTQELFSFCVFMTAARLHDTFSPVVFLFQLLSRLPLVNAQNTTQAIYPFLQAGSTERPGSSLRLGEVRKTIGFMTHTALAGFEVLDFQDPAQPSTIAVYGQATATPTQQLLALGPDDQFVVLLDKQSGELSLVNTSNPKLPQKMASSVGFQADGMTLSLDKKTAFLARLTPTGPKLFRVDLTDLTDVHLVSSRSFPWYSPTIPAPFNATAFLLARPNEELLLSYSAVASSGHYETALVSFDTRDLNAPSVKNQQVSTGTNANQISFGALSGMTASANNQSVYLTVTQLSAQTPFPSETDGFLPGLYLVNNTLSFVSNLTYTPGTGVALLNQRTAVQFDPNTNLVNFVYLAQWLGYQVFLLSLSGSVQIQSFDLSQLSQTFPTVIRQGNQYYVYTNTTQSATWQLSPLNATAAASLPFPSTGAPALALSYARSFQSLYDELAAQQFYTRRAFSAAQRVLSQWQINQLLRVSITESWFYVHTATQIISALFQPELGVQSDALSVQARFPIIDYTSRSFAISPNGALICIDSTGYSAYLYKISSPESPKNWILASKLNYDSTTSKTFSFSSDSRSLLTSSARALYLLNISDPFHPVSLSNHSIINTELSGVSSVLLDPTRPLLYVVDMYNFLIFNTSNISRSIASFPMFVILVDQLQLDLSNNMLYGFDDGPPSRYYRVNVTNASSPGSLESLFRFDPAAVLSFLGLTRPYFVASTSPGQNEIAALNLYSLKANNQPELQTTFMTSCSRTITTSLSPSSDQQTLVAGCLSDPHNNRVHLLSLKQGRELSPIADFLVPEIYSIFQTEFQPSQRMIWVIERSQSLTAIKINPSTFGIQPFVGPSFNALSTTLVTGQSNTVALVFFINTAATLKPSTQPPIQLVQQVNDDQTLSPAPVWINRTSDTRWIISPPTSFTSPTLTLLITFNELFNNRVQFNVTSVAPTTALTTLASTTTARVGTASATTTIATTAGSSLAPSTSAAHAFPFPTRGTDPNGQTPVPASNFVISTDNRLIQVIATSSGVVQIGIGLANPLAGKFVRPNPVTTVYTTYDAFSGQLELVGTLADVNQALAQQLFAPRIAGDNVNDSPIDVFARNEETNWQHAQTTLDRFKILRPPNTLRNWLPNQTLAIGKLISVPFDLNATFTDPNGLPLTVTWELANGDDWPTWLTFSTKTNMFVGFAQQDVELLITGRASNGYYQSEPTHFFAIVLYIAVQALRSVDNQAVLVNNFFSFFLPSMLFAGNNIHYNATLPLGVSFNPTGMMIMGLLRRLGVFNVTIFATDDKTSDAVTFSIISYDEGPNITDVIPMSTGKVNQELTLLIPSRIIHYSPNAGNPLSYTLAAVNGSQLPHWLTFNPSSLTATGIPPLEAAGKLFEFLFFVTNGFSTAQTRVQLFIQTILAPIINQQFTNQSATVDAKWRYKLPINAFVDPGNYSISLSFALLSSPNPQDSDLTARTFTLNGDELTWTTPTDADVGETILLISASNLASVGSAGTASQPLVIITSRTAAQSIWVYIGIAGGLVALGSGAIGCIQSTYGFARLRFAFLNIWGGMTGSYIISTPRFHGDPPEYTLPIKLHQWHPKASISVRRPVASIDDSIDRTCAQCLSCFSCCCHSPYNDFTLNEISDGQRPWIEYDETTFTFRLVPNLIPFRTPTYTVQLRTDAGRVVLEFSLDVQPYRAPSVITSTSAENSSSSASHGFHTPVNHQSKKALNAPPVAEEMVVKAARAPSTSRSSDESELAKALLTVPPQNPIDQVQQQHGQAARASFHQLPTHGFHAKKNNPLPTTQTAFHTIKSPRFGASLS